MKQALVLMCLILACLTQSQLRGSKQKVAQQQDIQQELQINDDYTYLQLSSTLSESAPMEELIWNDDMEIANEMGMPGVEWEPIHNEEYMEVIDYYLSFQDTATL